jgi:hypothetical protein
MIVRDDEREPAIGALSMLTTREPDAARATRGVRRGRTMLAERARRRPPAPRLTPRGGWRLVLEPLLVAGVCAVFLFEVISRAAALYRF